MTFYTLQFLRFIAALLVMCHHLDITRSGNRGVDIFFAISGFVIYNKLFSPDRPGAFHFFTNRVTKIFFLYWLALILMYVAAPFPLNASIIKTIFLVPNHDPWLMVSWSLTFELYFYFFTGAAVYLLPGRYAKVFFLLYLAASSIVITLYLSGKIQIKGSPVNFLLGKNTWGFLLGLLSGYLSNTVFKSSKVNMAVPVCILAAVLLSAIFIYPSNSLVPVFIVGIVSMFLVCLSAVAERIKALPAQLAFIFKILGDASYAIYLLAPVMGAFIPGRTVVDKIAIIVATIGLSIFLNQVIENRSLKYLREKIYRIGG